MTPLTVMEAPVAESSVAVPASETTISTTTDSSNEVKHYLGTKKGPGTRRGCSLVPGEDVTEAFQSATTPNSVTYPQYHTVKGPFDTAQDAWDVYKQGL